MAGTHLSLLFAVAAETATTAAQATTRLQQMPLLCTPFFALRCTAVQWVPHVRASPYRDLVVQVPLVLYAPAPPRTE